MTKRRNLHRRAATQQSRQARDNQKAQPAKQQLAYTDFRRSRTAGNKKLNHFVKRWRGRRSQQVATRSANTGLR